MKQNFNYLVQLPAEKDCKQSQKASQNLEWPRNGETMIEKSRLKGTSKDL